MSSPYRDAVPTTDAEPTPAFRAPERNGPCFLGVFTAIILTIGITDWVRGLHDSAVVFLAMQLPGLALTALGLVLEPRIRAWHQRRYARAVARGIVELEARASRIGAEHEA